MITSTLSKYTDLWLEITKEVELKSWESSQAYSSDFTRWRAYLNEVTQESLVTYLLVEQDFNATVWPSKEASAKVWELFNGTAISLGQKRLVLLPTEIVDKDEFRVPQEWVDVPKLVGDYYLAVQVNPDDQSLLIWGYTTHKDLKVKASYDVSDRTYCLEGNHLIKNLSVLWLCYELCPQETTQFVVAALPSLPPTQGQNLVQRLANTEIIEPRLEVPFSMWGSLLELDNIFDELCDRRLGREVKKPVNLARWVENIFEAGWESLEAIFLNQTAGSYRRNNNQGAIKRAKYLEIAPNQRIVLQLELTPQENNRSNVAVKLTPQSGHRYLPSNINLRLLSQVKEVIYAAKANGGQVNFIKKEINLGAGESFTIEISLDDFNNSENFTV